MFEKVTASSPRDVAHLAVRFDPIRFDPIRFDSIPIEAPKKPTGGDGVMVMMDAATQRATRVADGRRADRIGLVEEVSVDRKLLGGRFRDFVWVDEDFWTRGRNAWHEWNGSGPCFLCVEWMASDWTGTQKRRGTARDNQNDHGPRWQPRRTAGWGSIDHPVFSCTNAQILRRECFD
jgi:hypothetical protein